MTKPKKAPIAPKPNFAERTMGLKPNPSATHRFVGGTGYDDFNQRVMWQAARAAWYGGKDQAETDKVILGTVTAMAGIEPKDAVEGMLAAQMVATHNAAMQCFSWAMIEAQPFDARDTLLSQANKLMRSYTTLVHALDKHRGKGQQTVRVEHVHVHSGGQAIVGNVDGRRLAEAPSPLSVGHVETDDLHFAEASVSHVLPGGGDKT